MAGQSPHGLVTPSACAVNGAAANAMATRREVRAMVNGCLRVENNSHRGLVVFS